MQKSGFRLLLGVTVVLVAAAIYALASGDRAANPAAHDERAFPDLAARLGDLAWMRVTHGVMKADFNLVGGHWVVVEKGNYPAMPGKMRQTILGLADLTLVEAKTARPDLFGRLDLDDPSNGKSTLVTLQDRTGKTVAELIVGKVRHDRLGGGNAAVYVRKPTGDRAWLARGSLDLPDDIAGWLDRSILDIAASSIASVTLTGNDGAALVLRRDKRDGAFAVADAPPDAKFKDEAALAGPAAALAGLALDDVKPAAELPVPQDGAATAVFTTFEGLTVTLRLFSHDKADWVTIAASGSGDAEKEAAAIDTKVGRWVYAIPDSRAKLLRTTLADLIEPQKGS
jgi:Domain of unknown function (DUF4340)